MSLLELLGVLSPAHIKFFTAKAKGREVGRDALGNVYYEARPRPGYSRTRRWVMYKGAPEASSVPPEWHGWLHHQTDVVPSAAEETYRRPWQKPPQPNLTGTSGAYRPKGHILKGGERDKATGDYEAWKPQD